MNKHCDEMLTYDSGSVCFLERVDFYYPEEDNNCAAGCPHCHDCPLLQLGDRFGPLEIVGFGNERTLRDKHDEHMCTSCDNQSWKTCDRRRDCKDRFHCDETTDCRTGEILGLPSFFENKCSFVDPEKTIGEDNAVDMSKHHHPHEKPKSPNPPDKMPKPPKPPNPHEASKSPSSQKDGEKSPPKPNPPQKGIKGDAAKDIGPEAETVITKATAGENMGGQHHRNLIPIVTSVCAVSAVLLALLLYAHHKRNKTKPSGRENKAHEVSRHERTMWKTEGDEVEVMYNNDAS